MTNAVEAYYFLNVRFHQKLKSSYAFQRESEPIMHIAASHMKITEILLLISEAVLLSITGFNNNNLALLSEYSAINSVL